MQALTLFETEFRVFDTGVIHKKNKHTNNWAECPVHLTDITPKNKFQYCNTEIKFNGKKKKLRIHRLVACAFLGLEMDNRKSLVDHIDHNTKNNALTNLRIVTNQENQFNNSCKGVTMRSSGKFRARIRVDGNLICLGEFKEEKDAITAYKAAKIKYHTINKCLDDQLVQKI